VNLICDNSHSEDAIVEGGIELSERGLRKLIYLLPSGRRLKVVINDENGHDSCFPNRTDAA